MGWFRNLGDDRPWAQGCVIAAAGTALAATSCFGMWMGYDVGRGTPLGSVYSIGVTIFFVLSLLTIPFGFIWFIVGLVRNATKRAAAPPPPAPPAPPGGA